MPTRSNNLAFDPFQVEPIINPNAESVISSYHPANNRRHSESNQTYTFRQRQQKLNLTLGWELEANHAPSRIPTGVQHLSDGSVDGDGAEFVVMPAVTKSPRYVLGLLKDLVHSPRLNTNDSCGFHVHVSASNLSSIARMRQWAIATEHLALQVEDLAFKAVPSSRSGNSYCRRITPLTHGTSFASHKYNNNRRYHWLNIVEMFRPGGIRTIEVRLLGNTHRWKYVLAWSLFSMELARRGWDVANKPFEVAGHVDALGQMLNRIAKEIKPLEHKTEPVPQWVYEGLNSFGIEANTFERPLAALSEAESNVRGQSPRFYSDNQEVEETSNDDDDNSCSCGCGEDGTCSTQLHSDGDCDSSYCTYCHEDGNCSGLPACDSCIERAHDNDEDCTRSRCGTCHPVPRPVTPPASTVRVSSVSDPLNFQPVTAAESNMTFSGVTTGRIEARRGISPASSEAMRLAMEQLHNVAIDHTRLQMGMYRVIHDEMMYGTGIAPMVWSEAEAANWVSSPIDMTSTRIVLPTLPEELALPMTDAERLASDARERTSPTQSIRALTVTEANRTEEERHAYEIMTSQEQADSGYRFYHPTEGR